MNRQALCRPAAICFASVKGPAMSLDPWSKAAECDRAIERVADPERRVVLESLRLLWLDICKSLLIERPDQTSYLSAIAQMHTEFMAGCRTAMH
jgi:hypothetical protein